MHQEIPGPFSWRPIRLDAGRREIWKGITSTRFPSQHSYSSSALPPPWERGAEYVPAWSTYFNSVSFWKLFSNLLAWRQLLWVAEPANLTQDPLFTGAQIPCSPSHLLCSGAIQRNKHTSHRLFLSSLCCFCLRTPPSQWINSLLTLYGWKELLRFLPYVLLISPTKHDTDLWKLVSFSVSSWHASYKVVFSAEDISIVIAGFSRGISY